MENEQLKTYKAEIFQPQTSEPLQKTLSNPVRSGKNNDVTPKRRVGRKDAYKPKRRQKSGRKNSHRKVASQPVVDYADGGKQCKFVFFHDCTENISDLMQ